MNLITNNIFIILTSFLISIIFLIKIKPFLTLDIPNKRSSHNYPIHRGGGLAFVFVSLLSIPFLKFYSLLILLPLIIVGYLDDLFSLSPRIRYLFQLITVYFILSISLNLSVNNIYLYLLFLIAGTALINFTNFIDGIDGLLASNMIITFIHISILNQNNNLTALIGGLLAFFLFNKSPAKVFMGDVGSTFLGAVLFMEIIKINEYKQAFLSFAGSFPIYCDALLCLIARFVSKENIFLSHKEHLYQRLVSSSFTHNKISLIYSLSSLLICLSCYTYNIKVVALVMSFVFTMGLILNAFYAKPFLEK